MTNRISSVVDIDVNKAIAALKNVEKGLDGTESSAERAARAMEAMADVITSESVAASNAVEKMSAALGSEFVADLERAGGSVDELVASLNRAGVAYDDVAMNADRLATSVKKVDTASRGTAVSIDGVTRSGDQSRSVLANMVGNSAQDIGALSGVAGSAGVALGQLAEYAADGNIQLKNMAGLGVGLAGLGVAMWAVNRSAEQSAKNLEALNEQVDRLATAADSQVVDAFAQSLALGFVEGKSFQDVVNQMAEDELPGLKRALDLGTESGRLNADMQRMMADAINEAERAAAQGAETTERYGDSTAAAAEAAEVLAQSTSRAGSVARTHGAELGILQNKVDNYRNSVNDIPEEMLTAIEAAIDAGDLARAEFLLNEVTRSRVVQVGIAINQGAIAGAAAGSSSGVSLGKAIGASIAAGIAGVKMPSLSGGGGGGGGGGSSPAEAEATSWAEAIARAYAYGEITRDEYRKYLADRLAGEEKYGDAYDKTWREIQALDKEAASEREAAERDRLALEKKAADEAEKAAKEAADAAKDATREIERSQQALGNLIINVTNTSADPQSVVRAIEQARRMFGNRWLTG